MKKIVFFAILVITTFSSFSQKKIDVYKWMVSQNLKNGLPGKGLRGPLKEGDIHCTIGYTATCPVSKDKNGTTSYPFSMNPKIRVVVYENNTLIDIVVTIINAPHDVDSWEQICIKSQSGSWVETIMGWEFIYDYPLSIQVSREIIDANGNLVPDYTGRLIY